MKQKFELQNSDKLANEHYLSENKYKEQYKKLIYSGNDNESVQSSIESIKDIASEKGDNLIDILAFCAKSYGSLSPRIAQHLIYKESPCKNHDLATQMVAKGVFDLSSNFFCNVAPDNKATISWYAKKNGATNVVKMCELIRLNPLLKNESNYNNNLPDINSLEEGSINEFNASFQQSYIGEFLSRGGSAGVYELKNHTDKVIRISSINSSKDYIKNNTKYQNECRLKLFKDEYPELPIAKIYNSFFINTKNIIFLDKFYIKHIDLIAEASDKDLYYLVTVMEKLIQGKIKLTDQAVINAKNALKEKGIYVEDFKDRNIMIKKVSKPCNEESKIMLTDLPFPSLTSDFMCSDYEIKDGTISYKEVVFIDYDEYTVPPIGSESYINIESNI